MKRRGIRMLLGTAFLLCAVFPTCVAIRLFTQPVAPALSTSFQDAGSYTVVVYRHPLFDSNPHILPWLATILALALGSAGFYFLVTRPRSSPDS